MRFLILTLFSLPVFSAPFTDPSTGLEFELPQGFTLMEGESLPYQFVHPNGDFILLEIDRYEKKKNLSEHFHSTLTDLSDTDQLLCEGLEFQNVVINGKTFTNCRLRILSLSEMEIDPLYVSDYLFVHGHFGFSINILSERNCTTNEPDEMMEHLLSTVTFH